ncbi:hypothetical protein GGF31_008212 [Allomyces arbusculus]|nr:hypothetical protein GGF31_008212 [Allomyces arbusculus]
MSRTRTPTASAATIPPSATSSPNRRPAADPHAPVLAVAPPCRGSPAWLAARAHFWATYALAILFSTAATTALLAVSLFVPSAALTVADLMEPARVALLGATDDHGGLKTASDEAEVAAVAKRATTPALERIEAAPLLPSPATKDHHHARHHPHRSPRISMRVADYARHHGFECTSSFAHTDDGFVLAIDRITHPTRSDATKPPIILMHGLFQGSGVFVTSGPHSLAFFLADHGFAVYLANNRCDRAVTSFGSTKHHTHRSRRDPRFWDWTLSTLARHDFPAIIAHVRRTANAEKVVWIGHSQGNAQAFLGLHYHPHLNHQLVALIALAPALFMGPLAGHPVPAECPHAAAAADAARKGPFAHLVHLATTRPSTFATIFGPASVVPVMHHAQRLLPARVFTALAYRMFKYLFGWTDRHWAHERKAHYFQFTPRPVSTRSLAEWLGNVKAGFVRVMPSEAPVDLDTRVTCATALFSGGRDFLVTTAPFRDARVRRAMMRSAAGPHVGVEGEGLRRGPPRGSAGAHHAPHDSACGVPSPKLDGAEAESDADSAVNGEEAVAGFRAVHDVTLPEYEHMDFLWAKDAHARLWPQMVRVIDEAWAAVGVEGRRG